MARNKRKVEDDQIEATWLNTYADMVTLLLCFFVLLFAMSTISSSKFNQLILSFQSEGSAIFEKFFGPSVVPLDENGTTSSTKYETEDEKFEKINRDIRQFISERGLSSSVSVFKQDDGVLIRFHDSVLFDKGSAVLKTEARKILLEMSSLLNQYNRMIKVEGHTDSDPINNPIYPSNWELSTARAVNVVRFLIEEVPPDRRISPELLQASGYGEYHPIVENDSEQNKAKNRRIEIMILKSFE